MSYSTKEPWHYWRDAGGARAFFSSAAKAVKDMERWRVIADEGVDALALPSSGHGSGVSDPTANRAIWLADHDDAARREAMEKLEECERLIGAALIVISTVRKGLGSAYGDALDRHYIDGHTLGSIAEDLGVTKSAVHQRIGVALDWCDSQPVTYLFGGKVLTNTCTV